MVTRVNRCMKWYFYHEFVVTFWLLVGYSLVTRAKFIKPKQITQFWHKIDQQNYDKY